MGDLKGHSVPTIGFLISALIVIARAIRVPLTAPLRRNTLFIILLPLILVVIGMIGATGESIDMFFFSKPSNSHSMHIRLHLIIFFCGLVNLIHVVRKVKGKAWSLLPSLSFFLIAVMFLAHEQPSPLETMGHRTMVYLLLFLALAVAIEAIMAVHLVPEGCRHVLDHPETNKFLNWQYSNPAIYTSMWPQVTGFALALNGTFWLVLSLTFYTETFHYPANKPNETVAMIEMRDTMRSISMFYTSFLLAVILCLVVTILIQIVSARLYGVTSTNSSLSNGSVKEVLVDMDGIPIEHAD